MEPIEKSVEITQNFYEGNFEAMVERAKTTTLLQVGNLSEKRRANSALNGGEMRNGAVALDSKPGRLVFELTNMCNLNCIMCGRDSSEFAPTMFDYAWFDYFKPVFDTIEEVTLMGWGEPTLHPKFEDIQFMDISPDGEVLRI